LTSLLYQVSSRVWSGWPRLKPLAALLRLVQLPNSMPFELIGSTTQRGCQPRGLCASLDDALPAGGECSVLIYCSHNSHSLFNYTRVELSQLTMACSVYALVFMARAVGS